MSTVVAHDKYGEQSGGLSESEMRDRSSLDRRLSAGSRGRAARKLEPSEDHVQNTVLTIRLCRGYKSVRIVDIKVFTTPMAL